MRRLLLVLLLAAGAGGYWWWQQRQAAGAEDWQGYVDADYVKIGPTQSGLLTRVLVSRGDLVKPGDPLFDQDDADDSAARDEVKARLAEGEARLANIEAASRDTEIAQAEADLNDLRATQERAEKDRARAAALVRTGAGTVQQADQTQADALSAAAKVRAAQAKLDQMLAPTGRMQEIAAQVAVNAQTKAQLAQAEWRLAQRHVTAPAAGRIADVYGHPGEVMMAGAPVISLLPPESVLIRFFVPEAALPDLKPGKTVAIVCDTCARPMQARISFVATGPEYTPPVIYSESTRGKQIFLIEAHPEPGDIDALKPGQPVGVRLPAVSATAPPATAATGRPSS